MIWRCVETDIIDLWVQETEVVNARPVPRSAEGREYTGVPEWLTARASHSIKHFYKMFTLNFLGVWKQASQSL